MIRYEKNRIIFLSIFFTVFVLFWLMSNKFKILISVSNSLPARVYFLHYRTSFDRDDYVAIKGHKTKYINNIHFTKKVLGLSGDLIEVIADTVLINKVQRLKLKQFTLTGEHLTPIDNMIVPDGYVFVAGEHPDSFDSRYQEFGLVSIKDVEGKVIPIW